MDVNYRGNLCTASACITMYVFAISTYTMLFVSYSNITGKKWLNAKCQQMSRIVEVCLNLELEIHTAFRVSLKYLHSISPML